MENITPVFIGGAGRSGTTLLADMIGLHPDISPIYETDFLLGVAKIIFSPEIRDIQSLMFRSRKIIPYMAEWSEHLPLRPHNKGEHERYFHGPHYILFSREYAMKATHRFVSDLKSGDRVTAFRKYIFDLYGEHCRIDGKSSWVNKTPIYVKNLEALNTIFPGMYFIHCIRDGRDAACSVLSRNWGPSSFEEAANWWVDNVSSGMDFGRKNPERYIEVRFEDLVTNPSETILMVLRFLGREDDPESILKHYESKKNGISLTHSPMGRWRKEFSAEDEDVFKSIAGDILAHFGYSVSRTAG